MGRFCALQKDMQEVIVIVLLAVDEMLSRRPAESSATQPRESEGK